MIRNSVAGEGTYWKLSPRLGVKLPYMDRMNHSKYEAWCLKKINKRTKLFPKFIRLEKFIFRRAIHLGIVMEHIKGRRNWRKFEELEDAIDKQLRKAGIEFGDLHDYNVLFTGNKFRCVDADPSFINFLRRNT